MAEVLQRHCASGDHAGALLSLSLDGEVFQWCAGDDGAGQPLETDSRIPWLSAGKPLTAVAVAQLIERGVLGWDDAIARHVPEFAAGGKQHVTVRQVLTHTGGFVSLYDLDGAADSWEDAVSRVCASRQKRDWDPVSRAAYQPRSGWLILGEIVRRLSGQPLDRYVAECITGPMGMNDTVLCANGEAQELAKRRIPLYDTSGPVPVLWDLTVPCSPGASAVGTVDDLRRLYEVLLAGGRLPTGQGLLASTVQDLVSPHRVGRVDETFRHIVDWGLGFVVDSNRYGADTVPYGYGRHCSDATFGHGGSQCCTGFADPKHRLAVALAVNGRPGEERHNTRFRAALTALYEDLNLSTSTTS